MSLRRMLGADTDRVHEQVDAILDSEDGRIVPIDGSRPISYAHGFGMSPCQLEFLMVEIERTVRNVVGPPINNRRDRRNDGEESEVGRLDHGGNGRVVDRRTESARTRGSGDSNSGIATGRVLRMAREAAATDAG
jgi:hypothetical protein